jgi:glycosyltransferase involved in cell wall biosynthesis
MTAALLETARSHGWAVLHADTSDHRSIDNVGRFDAQNVVLALRHVAGFASLLRRERPEIVYLPLSQGVAGFARDALLLCLARLAKARVVVHAHGGQYGEFYRGMPAAGRALMRLAMRPVDTILVLGQGQTHQFDGWARPDVRVRVVPNGVRDEWPAGVPERRRGAGRTVLFLGNLLPEKGFLDVLAAIPHVRRAVPACRFIFAGRLPGGGTTAADLQRRLAPDTLGAVAFVGVVGAAERHRLLECADVLVFPPRWNEGQGLVALEAMSAGLPVIATRSGGLAETLRDGVDGLFVPKSDPVGIAAALIVLLQDDEARLRMGRSARERYLAEYSLERWRHRMDYELLRESER